MTSCTEHTFVDGSWRSLSWWASGSSALGRSPALSVARRRRPAGEPTHLRGAAGRHVVGHRVPDRAGAAIRVRSSRPSRTPTGSTRVPSFPARCSASPRSAEVAGRFGYLALTLIRHAGTVRRHNILWLSGLCDALGATPTRIASSTPGPPTAARPSVDGANVPRAPAATPRSNGSRRSGLVVVKRDGSKEPFSREKLAPGSATHSRIARSCPPRSRTWWNASRLGCVGAGPRCPPRWWAARSWPPSARPTRSPTFGSHRCTRISRGSADFERELVSLQKKDPAKRRPAQPAPPARHGLAAEVAESGCPPPLVPDTYVGSLLTEKIPNHKMLRVSNRPDVENRRARITCL